jgi:hypothetical protein
VTGFQGSWCYDRGCLDVIPPDKADLPPIEVPKNAALTFNLAETHPFVYWKVDYAPEQDVYPFTKLEEGGIYVDPDIGPATSPPKLTTFSFDAPPAGNWVLAVHLQFPDELGGTVYYWHAVVN